MAKSVSDILEIEHKFGLETLNAYSNFQRTCGKDSFGFLSFYYRHQKRRKKTVAGYGAAARKHAPELLRVKGRK